MTCKDCVHNEICKYGENRSNGLYCTGEKCRQFKHKSRFVELPCEVGQKVWFIKRNCDKPDEIVSLYVYQIEIDKDDIWIRANDGVFNLVRSYTDYYYSREEAEKALHRKEDGSNG